MKSGASGYSVLAAPEDGRTPPTSLPPSLTHYKILSNTYCAGKRRLLYSALRFPRAGKRNSLTKPLTDNCSLYGWTTHSYPTEGL